MDPLYLFLWIRKTPAILESCRRRAGSTDSGENTTGCLGTRMGTPYGSFSLKAPFHCEAPSTLTGAAVCRSSCARVHDRGDVRIAALRCLQCAALLSSLPNRLPGLQACDARQGRSVSGTNVVALWRALQGPSLDRRRESSAACVAVESPRALCLSFSKLQPGHFEVLAPHTSKNGCHPWSRCSLDALSLDDFGTSCLAHVCSVPKFGNETFA